jgi:hypothetical protein
MTLAQEVLGEAIGGDRDAGDAWMSITGGGDEGA